MFGTVLGKPVPSIPDAGAPPEEVVLRQREARCLFAGQGMTPAVALMYAAGFAHARGTGIAPCARCRGLSGVVDASTKVAVPASEAGPLFALRGAARTTGWVVAGTIDAALPPFLAPPVAGVALKSRPAAHFAIIVFAFTTVSAVQGASMLHAMASPAVGSTIDLVGMDPISGQARDMAGVPELVDGIDVVLVAVGLFALAEGSHRVICDGEPDSGCNRMSSAGTAARLGLLPRDPAGRRSRHGYALGCVTPENRRAALVPAPFSPMR